MTEDAQPRRESGADDPGRVVFFGTKDTPGHYFFEPGGWERSLTPVGPWGHVDGKLSPRHTSAQGAALLHHLQGWTALALHDYTVDARPGSNAVFLFDARLEFDRAVEVAAAHFPEITARIGQISDVGTGGTGSPHEEGCER